MQGAAIVIFLTGLPNSKLKMFARALQKGVTLSNFWICNIGTETLLLWNAIWRVGILKFEIA